MTENERQDIVSPTEIEHEEAPEPKRHPSFSLGKVGFAIIAVLMVGLIAWHVGYSPDPFAIGRDAGGFAGGSDYGGGGGGSDWGGSSSYGGGSSYDWGGSSSYDWGGSSSYSGSSSSHYDDGDFDIVDLIAAVIIVVLVFGKGFIPLNIFPRKSKSSKNPRHSGKSQPAGASRTLQSQLQPISELQKRDPAFSAAAVEEMIANVYVQMQQAWTAGDFEPMRPYFSNTLFSQFSSQLEALTKQGKVNHVDNIAVLETQVRGWYDTNGYEYLVMKVRTRITDYTLDKNGKVVSGRTDAELFMEYEYTLGRTAGVKTGQVGQTQADSCPHCGAPINLAQSAKCTYCGSVIESNRFTWVITAIKGISQQTR